MTEYFKDVDHDEAKRRLNNYYACMQRCDDYTRFKNEQSTYSKMLREFYARFYPEKQNDN